MDSKKCIALLFYYKSISMSLQGRALGTAASPILRARLLSLPPVCRALSIESALTLARLSRPINKATDRRRLYSTDNAAKVLANFKKSCKMSSGGFLTKTNNSTSTVSCSIV
jgi:hypothetical protein